MKRRFIAGFILIAGGLAIWAFGYEPSRLIVKDYNLKISGAADAGLSGLKIAVIADLHAGAPFIDTDKIQRIVAQTNAAKPDVILLLGDYVQHVLGEKHIPFEAVASILQGLKAPLGIYAVMGNHDWWENYYGISGALSANGITVVDDRSEEVSKDNRAFYLTGISDYYEGPHNFQQALQKIPSNRKALCVTHTPDVFPELPGTCLLTIAGHTHGGQVNLPILGRLIVPSRYGSRYAAGLVQEQGHYLFVSTGIGTSIIGVRFNVPPEISILHIM